MRPISLNYLLGLPLVIVCAFAVLLTVLPKDSTDTTQRADYYHYVAMAYNTARYGIMAHRESSPVPARPSRLREPLYPLTLTVALFLSDGALEQSLKCVAAKSACAGIRKHLMLVNIVTIVLLVGALFVATRIITRSWIAAYLASLLLLSGNFFVIANSQIKLSSEPLAALLLLLHGLFLYLLVRDPRRRLLYAALAGLFLGLLVLTKAVFQFWPLLIGLGCAAYLVFSFRTPHPVFIPVAIVLVLSSLAPPAAWSVRNYVHFGDFKLSDRGGRQLLGRVVFVDMRPGEYRGALCAWSPRQPTFLKTFFCDGVEPSDMARFDRTKKAEGTFDKFKKRKKEEYEQLKSRGLTTLSWDDYYKDAALDMLGENLFKHVALTPLFVYRGMWINVRPRQENTRVLPFSLARPFEVAGNFTSHLSGVFLPSALVLGLIALLRRRYDLLLFVLPALYSIGIHSVFTTYIPRYSTPLVPVLMVCFFCLWVAAARRLRGREAGPRRLDE